MSHAVRIEVELSDCWCDPMTPPTRCPRTELLVTACAHCRPPESAQPSGDRQTPVNTSAYPARTRQRSTDRISRSTVTPADDRTSSAELTARFMPAGLVDLYERLLAEEFGAQRLGSSRPGDPYALVGVGRASGGLRATKSGQADIRAGARRGKGPAPAVPLRSERAMHYRTKVDRRLRKIVVELRSYLASLDDPAAVPLPVVRQCVGKCKKFGDTDWLYCPRCGGPMSEMDR